MLTQFPRANIFLLDVWNVSFMPKHKYTLIRADLKSEQSCWPDAQKQERRNSSWVDFFL